MSDTLRGPREVYGPFLVHERLGTGGMAEVHRATRTLPDGSEIEVGLKRLHRHLLDDPRAVGDFVEEARIAALMEHRSICRFYEAGRLGDSYFIAMEYIEGRHLGSVLREARANGRPPPLSVVLSLLCQLCDALEYAHNRADEDSGVPLDFVHRDVSPANLLVGRDGRLRLIDLGIAKARTREIRTDTGVIKGKFGYMAPEVLIGARADRRADIFAVGVVGWELVTAESLFTGASDVETMERLRVGAVEPPSSRRHACPPQLDAILMRALARRPRDRWRTASAMRTALRALAAALHEPVSLDVVAQWLAAAEPVPIPITSEHSDAITEVRHRTPRNMPRRPARFPAGTERMPKVEPEEVAAPAPTAAAGERVPLVVAEEERRYRALAMLGGGLLTTLVIAGLLVTRSRGSGDLARLPLELRRPVAVVTEPAAPVAAASVAEVAARPVAEEAGAAAAPASLEVGARDMKRVSGKLPRSRGSRARYRARVCVDARGKVSSVDVTAGPQRLHRRIARHLRRWRYRPFRRDGAPTAVCFEVARRLLPWR